MSLTLVLLLVTTTPVELFNRANSLYEAGRFEEAVVVYDSAAMFITAPEVYYNRGNAQFKLGKLGRALADYLRAWALKPHDPDITNNIGFVRNFRPDKNPGSESPLVTLARNILTPLDLLTTRFFAGVSFFLLALGLGLYLGTGKRFFGYGAVVLAIGFLYFGAATLVWNGIVSPAKAVIVVPEAVLRSGPGEEYKEIAAVHDGLEVKIVERRPGFVLIQIPGGVGGWVEDKAVEQVFE
ncbi:tetratricopeptide repeat protein [candidate division WOR-3 bacterium]|nr:tetratricopeptide repeat protein [candidate division WOR-3 bacterium]